MRAWRDYALLLLVLALVRSELKSRSEALKTVEHWMVAALVIAAGGVLIAWGPRPLKELPWWQLRVKLLKLYPFRLADMLVPITVSFTVAAGLWQLIEQRFSPRLRAALLTAHKGVKTLTSTEAVSSQPNWSVILTI